MWPRYGIWVVYAICYHYISCFDGKEIICLVPQILHCISLALFKHLNKNNTSCECFILNVFVWSTTMHHFSHLIPLIAHSLSTYFFLTSILSWLYTLLKTMVHDWRTTIGEYKAQDTWTSFAWLGVSTLMPQLCLT